jgi:hypothetical protein
MPRKQIIFLLALLLVLEMIGAVLIPFFGRFLSFSASADLQPARRAPVAAVDRQP